MYNFTREDLLQYMYKETSTEKTAAIKAALSTDWILNEKYNVLLSSGEQLDSIKLMAPRQQSIDAILAYAEKSIEEFSTQS